MISQKKIFFYLTVVFLISCSTQKDTLVNRVYHQLNTKYNGLFYANDYLGKGIKQIKQSHVDDFSETITLNMFSDKKSSASSQSYFDQAIQRSTKAIEKHSMDISGIEKNKFIDEAYIIIGKSKFFKRDYNSAIKTFNYLLLESSSSDSKIESMIWIAKCHQQANNQSRLQQTINNLESNYSLNNRQKSELEAVKAEHFALQEKNDESIEALLNVIKLTKEKELKTRAFFKLGQVYFINNLYKQSRDCFKNVIKLNPNYEMVFNSKLNISKTFQSQENNFEELSKSLNEMIKDKKNKDYLGQVFYALADLQLKNRDTVSAINSLKKSTTNTISQDQKLESHFLLATIFWKNKNYIKSYNHSDTAKTLADSKYPNYELIKSIYSNSKNIARHYIKINYNDSVINLSLKPIDEINNIVDNLIVELRAIESKNNNDSKLSNNIERGFNSYEYNKQAKNSLNITSGGGWYFYNPSAISLGYSEFNTRWGNRKLEDNWRRKNKEDMTNPEGLLDSEMVNAPSEKEKYSRDYYISKLPMEQFERDSLLAQIEMAYFDLSNIFKSELQDYKMSVELYDSLLYRFPQTEYKPLIYQDLYNIYKTLGDTILSDKYLKSLSSEFPGRLNKLNSNGLTYSNEELERANKNYLEFYSLFSNDRSKACSLLSDYKNKDDINTDKFELLSILCEAKNTSRDELITKLKEYKQNFSESIISNYADSLASILSGQSVEAFNYIYQNEFDNKHFFVLVLSDININLPDLQRTISFFNQENFQLDSLKTENMLLNRKKQLLRVGEFKNKTEAMLYFELFKADKSAATIFENNFIAPLVVSENNFFILLRQKNMDNYVEYFNEFYLFN